MFDQGNNKHSMTGPQGNGEFCFLQTEGRGETKLIVYRAGASY